MKRRRGGLTVVGHRKSHTGRHFPSSVRSGDRRGSIRPSVNINQRGTTVAVTYDVFGTVGVVIGRRGGNNRYFNKLLGSTCTVVGALQSNVSRDFWSIGPTQKWFMSVFKRKGEQDTPSLAPSLSPKWRRNVVIFFVNYRFFPTK